MTLKEMVGIQINKIQPISYGYFTLCLIQVFVENELAKSIAGFFSGLSLIVMIAFPIGYSKSTIKNPVVIFWNIVLFFICLLVGADFYTSIELLTGKQDEKHSVFILATLGSLLFVYIVTGLGIRARKKDEELQP